MTLNLVTQDVLNEQIKLLNSQFTLDDVDEQVVDLENEEDEISEQVMAKLLAKVNQKKRTFYNKIFTQQATRHVVMQVEESFKENVSNARKELLQDRNNAFVSTDPSITQYLDQRIDNMQDEELVSLSQTLSLAQHQSDNVEKLKESLTGYRAAVDRNKHEHDLSSQLEATFTTSPQENIQRNLLTSQSPILDELAKLRTLCAKLQAKAQANPEQFKELIN